MMDEEVKSAANDLARSLNRLARIGATVALDDSVTLTPDPGDTEPTWIGVEWRTWDGAIYRLDVSYDPESGTWGVQD
jgi:hypothetical protein